LAWALPNSEFSFFFFYLFEIKISFQVWQGPQQGCQHQRLNCRPTKLEMLQNKFPKQKINKEIKFKSFQA
jgi:hypothetical protein